MTGNEGSPINTPAAMITRPITPGKNSWASENDRKAQEKQESEQARATNRERYENNSMQKNQAGVIPKMYIQPAIPLINPVVKARAATDPVPPKPLFTTKKKPSFAQLRKKISHSKTGSEDSDFGPANLHYPSRKAAEILGLPQPEEYSKDESLGDQAIDNHGEVSHRPSYSSDIRTIDVRLDHEQIIAAPLVGELSEIRDHRENDVTSGLDTGESHGMIHDRSDEELATPRPSKDTRVEGFLMPPPKIGNFGRVGNIAVVNSDLPRAEGFRGVIEGSQSPLKQELNGGNDSSLPAASDHLFRTSNSGQACEPNTYFGQQHSGVWENDSAVGYSLPPFSPDPEAYWRQQPPLQEGPGRSFSKTSRSPCAEKGNAKSEPENDHHGMHQEVFQQHQIKHFPDIRHEHRHQNITTNSWAKDNKSDSLPSHPSMSALSSPYWQEQSAVNEEPVHTFKRQSYGDLTQLSAGLQRLDIGLHQHVGDVLGKLSRLMIERDESVVGRILQEMGRFEDRMAIKLEAIDGQIRSTAEEVHNMKRMMQNDCADPNVTKNVLSELEKKLSSVEEAVRRSSQQMDRMNLRTRTQTPTSDNSEMRSSQANHPHQQVGDIRSRSEKLYEGNYQQRMGSRPSSKARSSNTGSRGHRSNSTVGSATGKGSEGHRRRSSNATDAKDVTNGPPDIRNHPAFASIRGEGQTLSCDQYGYPLGTAYQITSQLSSGDLGQGGWYQQAYGSG